MTKAVRKVIWVIGAGSGIGRALSIQLSHQGHQLILSGRRVERLEDLKSDLIHDGMVLPLDITKEDDLCHAYEQIKKKFGGLGSVDKRFTMD